ncbi:lectin like domain-containing protein [Lachnospiraceae bacterium HCP1S3_C3]
MKKRLGMVAACAALCFAMADCDNIYAIESKEVQQQYEVNYDTYIEEGMPDVKPVNREYELDRSADVLPACYDARENQKVSAVKNQDYNNKAYGTCWAFASSSVSENNIIKRLGSDDADLSEMHLTYFAYHRPADPSGGTAGDYNEAVSADYRQLGGNANLTISSYASWMGPADESTLTYDNIENAGLTVDENLAYASDVAHMQNSYWISMQDKDIVKRLVMEHGGAQVTFRWNTSYYNYSKAAYYKNTNSNTGVNHAVTIVGWDDDYSADNFKKKPDKNGAWLIKNSWGDKWGDRGYFWISYEDGNIQNSTAYVFDYESKDNYKYNYQYDGAADLGRYASYNDEHAWMSNIFTTDSDKTLKAVSFYLMSPQMEYTVQIYKNIMDKNDPTSGTPVFDKPQQGSEELSGYYTVKLDKEVLLTKGESFSVVVCLIMPYGGVAMIPMEQTENVGYSVTAVSKPGQSFVSYDGEIWSDRDTSGNVRIKAFLDDTELNDSVWKIAAGVDENGAVSVTWQQNKAYDGYTVYRKYYGDEEFTGIADIDGNVSEYTDKSAKQGREYYYTVKGYVKSGNEKYYGRDSYSVYISTDIDTVYPISKIRSGKGMVLRWNKNSHVSGYLIYRCEKLDGEYSIVYNANSKSKTKYTDRTAEAGKEYYYKIRAYRINGNRVIYADYSAGV